MIMVCVRVLSGRKFREELGFTLIETIVTLVILVMVLGIVLSAMRLGIRSWEKGEAVIEGVAARMTVTSKLSGEIGSLYPFTVKTDGADAVLFRGGSKAFGFVTVSGSGIHGLPWGGARWEYYSVRDGKLTVREKTVPGVNVEADDGGRLVELDSGVAEIAFEYLGKDGWEGSWDASDKKALPEAVRIMISFNDGRKAITETVPVGLTHDRQKDRGTEGPAI